MSNFERDILIRNVKRLLEENNMTQAQLGEKIGMSQPNICKALSSNDKKCFTLDQVIGLAHHFNITIEALVGESQRSEFRITQRSVAIFLSELIAHHYAKFVNVKKTEEVYTPFWNNYTGGMDYDLSKKNNQYLAVYLPSYWEIPKQVSGSIDEDTINDLEAEARQCGNETNMLPVNEFLVRFKEIFEIYDNKGLTEETYNTVLFDMLNRLKDN